MPNIQQNEQQNPVQKSRKSPKYFSPEDGLIAETCQPRGGGVWADSSKEVSEEKSNEDLEDDNIMDLRLGLLIKGPEFNSNSYSNEQSEEPSEDDGEIKSLIL